MNITLICEQCGSEFIRSEARLKHGRGKHCSAACQYAAIKSRPAKALLRSCTCFNCNEAFEVYESWLKQRKGGGKYCSRQCRDAHWHGLNHPQYINGGNDDRGPNWQSQRRKTLKRDDHTCQCCSKAGQGVHHIVPFRLFGMERCSEANDLANLVTLCEPCHRIADATFQRNARG